jgi:hypothetical protein
MTKLTYVSTQGMAVRAVYKHIFGKPEPPLDREIRECLEKAAAAYLLRFKESLRDKV